MKICRRCINKIPSNLKKCPCCGKNPNKESSFLNVLSIFLLTIIFLLIIGGSCFVLFDKNINFKIDNKNNSEVKQVKGSFLKGEKTTICTKFEESDGYTTQTKYSIISKKDVVKEFTSEIISKYDDSETFKWSYAFIKEFYNSFGELEGFSSNIENNEENTYTAIIKIDYDKTNFENLYKYFNIKSESEYGFYKKNITIDEFTKNLDDYTCK